MAYGNTTAEKNEIFSCVSLTHIREEGGVHAGLSKVYPPQAGM